MLQACKELNRSEVVFRLELRPKTLAKRDDVTGAFSESRVGVKLMAQHS
jgi:hypothetical protein